MTSSPPHGAPVAGATLRGILACDDAAALRLLLAPAGQDVPVRDVSFGDEEPGRPAEDHVVLAAGPSADRPDAVAAVRAAARRGACAVVLRDTEGQGAAPAVPTAAEECGLAVPARAGWADWTDTASLVRSALAFTGAGHDPAAHPGDGDDDTAGGLGALASAIAGSTGGSITRGSRRPRHQAAPHARCAPHG